MKSVKAFLHIVGLLAFWTSQHQRRAAFPLIVLPLVWEEMFHNHYCTNDNKLRSEEQGSSALKLTDLS